MKNSLIQTTTIETLILNFYLDFQIAESETDSEQLRGVQEQLRESQELLRVAQERLRESQKQLREAQEQLREARERLRLSKISKMIAN